MRPLSNLIELLYGKNNGNFKVWTKMDKNIQNSFRVITHLGGGKGKNMTEVVSSMD